MRRVLVLGGTGDARRLAEALHGRAGVSVVSSLAGRVRAPLLPPGQVRVGGFGGPDGLAAWLLAEGIDAVVDATHPFAARMTANAVAATGATGTPLLVLRRPGWHEQPGDRWRRTPSLEAAAAALDAMSADRRVLLTTGRQGLGAFAGCRQWFVIRSVDPPDGPLPRRAELLLARGPFTVDGERELLRSHRVDAVVTKDSGGAATASKLVAARELGTLVIMVDRPPAPDVLAVATVDEAAAWVGRSSHTAW
ncbi:cobalt-precorrin-6A reductase [Pilimelia columellifera]|uniref:Cobalt-precorrin-6A reductase n=1 Tax=Pilimelia columellifera subsp. columellifera TaxID=706583 RepID=A0ABN3NL27_9ACTN